MSKRLVIDSTYFCGLRFDRVRDSRVLLDHLLERQGRTCFLVTPNVDHVVRASRDEKLRAIYSRADISVNDSRVLYRLCRIFGVDVGAPIPGSDITERLLERISGSDTRVTIIGASAHTVDVVRSKYSLYSVIHYNPPMGFISSPDEVEECIRHILSADGDLVFLAVGSPQQEILASRAIHAGARGVIACVGASLLFLSGEESRAPKLVQALALEWLFRLLQSPRRLAKRYIVDGPRIFYLLFLDLRSRKSKGGFDEG